MGRKRVRAHQNPLNTDIALEASAPRNPADMRWDEHFPSFFPAAQRGNGNDDDDAADASTTTAPPEVTIADIGCGFGGLLDVLSPHFPDKLIIGMEIRGEAVQIGNDRIAGLRKAAAAAAALANPAAGSPAADAAAAAAAAAVATTAAATTTTTATTTASALTETPPAYSNISVLRTNIMKYAANYFRRGQLEKIFILFADPHFKAKNFRRTFSECSADAILHWCPQFCLTCSCSSNATLLSSFT
jgi:tRNA (guanine-N7-)-methyltransferase